MILLAAAPNPAEVSNDHFAVIVGAIGVMFAALCGLAGIVIPLLLKTRRAAAVASEQTANNHESNLRDDIDGKHGEQARRFDNLERLVVANTAAVGELLGAVRSLGGRVHDIEQTHEGKP